MLIYTPGVFDVFTCGRRNRGGEAIRVSRFAKPSSQRQRHLGKEGMLSSNHPPEEIVSISVMLIDLGSSSSTISQTNCLVCTDNGVRGDYDRHPTARCARAPGCHDFRGAALPWSLAAQSNKLRHTEAVVLVRPSAPAASAFSHDGGGTTPGNPLVLGWHAALPFRVTFPNE